MMAEQPIDDDDDLLEDFSPPNDSQSEDDTIENFPNDKLTAEQVHLLETEGVLQPSISKSAAKRRVNAAFLAAPSNGASNVSGANADLTASMSYRSYHLKPDYELEVPLSEESAEAFEFIGLAPRLAKERSRTFCSIRHLEMAENNPLNFAQGRAEALLKEEYQDMNPRVALAKIGIKRSLRDAILDPEFEDVFQTKTLYDWVIESLAINYYTLCMLQARLKRHATYILGRDEVQQSASAAGTNDGPLSTAAPANSIKDQNVPQGCVVVQELAPIRKQHVMLYKARAAGDMLAHNFWIRDNDDLRIHAFKNTDDGGDFNLHLPAYYFATDKQVAERERQYLSRRCEHAETWLVQLQVSERFLDRLSIQNLEYGPRWKECVWHCRNSKKPPPEYRPLHRSEPDGVDVIRGPICSKSWSYLRHIHQEDIDELMSEDEVVMKCGNRHAMQVAFVYHEYDTNWNLGTELKGKVHVEVHAPSAGSTGMQSDQT